jgi:hypothetical protein
METLYLVVWKWVGIPASPDLLDSLALVAGQGLLRGGLVVVLRVDVRKWTAVKLFIQ